MSLIQSYRSRVPGATLYYEIGGAGPVLLMIHAGAGDARSFANTADLLANQYTVITYDRRGLSRSILENSSEEQWVKVHSDDAHRLLAQLCHKPAHVFGSSGGAVISLDLVTRHPEQVCTLVAHEPPARYLLPPFERSHESVQALYHREGAAIAFQQFTKNVRMNFADREPGVELPGPGTRSSDNIRFFFEQELGMYGRYRLDFAALKRAMVQTRIVLAGGYTGKEYIGYQSVTVVAERLGTTVVDFPGDHAGYITYPQAFARKLQDVLEEKARG